MCVLWATGILGPGWKWRVLHLDSISGHLVHPSRMPLSKIRQHPAKQLEQDLSHTPHSCGIACWYAWERNLQGLSVLRGMKCCFRSSTIFVEFDLHFFHSFTFFTCFQNGVICDFLLCRPYNPLQRQTTRTSLIPSILMHSLFFQLPLSSVSHLTTHPVRSQKLWRLRQH